MKSIKGFIVLLAAIGLTLAAVAWWTSLSRSGTSTPGSTNGAFDGTDVVQQYEPEDRRPLTRFTASLLDGSQFDSDDLLGRPAVVNVWGSWCVPCVTEAPELVEVAEEFTGQVQFVGINVRDNDAAARAFEDSYGIEYPSITTGTSSDAVLAFGPALPPSAVPSTLVVDTQGRLAARIVGPTDYSTLSTIVTETAAESDPDQ